MTLGGDSVIVVFLATFAIFVMVVFGMSLGFLVKRRSLQGSCGGIANLGIEKVCKCPTPCPARKKRMAAEAARHGRIL